MTKEKALLMAHEKPAKLMSNREKYLDCWCKGGSFYPSYICEFYKRGEPTIINGVEFW